MSHVNQYYYFSFSVFLGLPVAAILFISFPWWWCFLFKRGNTALLFPIALFLSVAHTVMREGSWDMQVVWL